MSENRRVQFNDIMFKFASDALNFSIVRQNSYAARSPAYSTSTTRSSSTRGQRGPSHRTTFFRTATSARQGSRTNSRPSSSRSYWREDETTQRPRHSGRRGRNGCCTTTNHTGRSRSVCASIAGQSTSRRAG